MTRPSNPNHRPLAAISRRNLLKGGAAIGAASALHSTPNATAQLQQAAKTLTIVLDGSPSTIDPHAAYDYRSILSVLGPYEGLIMLKDDSTTEYEGLVAASWEPNTDKSV